MLSKNKFQLFAIISFVCLLTIVGIILYQFWFSLSIAEQIIIGDVFNRYFGYLFVAFVLLIFAFGLTFDHFLNTYVLPQKRLLEELTIVASVNKSHRISVEGNRDLEAVEKLINEMADQVEVSKNKIQKTIEQAKRDIEEEKNTLAAVISGLPEGVIICNNNWQVILYNQKAKAILKNQNDSNSDNNVDTDNIGLGRSLLSILNKNQVVHVLDEIYNRLEKGEENINYHFAHVNEWGQMWNIHVIPILTDKRAIFGFVLVVNDLTQDIIHANQHETFMESLMNHIRSSMSSVRAAVETILDFPDMAREELEKLRKVILDESLNLSHFIERPEVESLFGTHSEWPMEDFQCQELVNMIGRKAKSDLDIELETEELSEDLWVKIDSFSIIYSFLFLLVKIKEKVDPNRINLKFEKNGKNVSFDLIWQGKPISLEVYEEWEDKSFQIAGETVPLTLKETIKQHKTAIWPQVTPDSLPRFRMMLPLVPAREASADLPTSINLEQRSEFYDFDMFNQAAYNTKFEDMQLKEVIYTVFDTETTGLDPKEDEIISIGAFRIVNNRLLREETFDRLIDPKRSLPKESIKYHGIQPEMLEGQPDISTTLPIFQRFVEDTVLVGHNVAFDMKMLQMKESTTGISFDNPVLDTLLLSAVIHPAQKNHAIEDIAKRLGIRVIGRHTALGDSLVTGECFLKMIPLLENKNIFTLKQAIEASKKTYYARLKY